MGDFFGFFDLFWVVDEWEYDVDVVVVFFDDFFDGGEFGFEEFWLVEIVFDFVLFEYWVFFVWFVFFIGCFFEFVGWGVEGFVLDWFWVEGSGNGFDIVGEFFNEFVEFVFFDEFDWVLVDVEDYVFSFEKIDIVGVGGGSFFGDFGY